MKQIVCLAAEPWSRWPKRTQQLLSRVRGAEILYFNPPVSTLSRLSGPRGRAHAAAYKRKERQTRPHIFVGALPPMRPFFEKSAAIERANAQRLARHILRCAQGHGFQSPALWLSSPVYAAVTEEFPASCVIYDCADFYEYPERMELALTARADVVFAAAPALAARLSAHNPNVALISDGADFQLYSRAGDGVGALPDGRLKAKSAVFGFAGALPPDTDFAPVLHAATLRPDWTFVFAGKLHTRAIPPALRALGNVRFCPCRSEAQAAEYTARFDLFFCLRAPTARVPERAHKPVLDAFAAGLPVVMMLGPDEEPPFPELAEAARTPAEFAAACRRAQLTRDGFFAGRRRRLSASCAWERRAEEVDRILEANGIV